MKPNILQNNCSFLVCDPSGELFRDTYKELKEAGYKIKVFNLVNMRYSNYYNPFAYIRDDAGIGVLVDTLIDNTNQEENASKGGSLLGEIRESALDGMHLLPEGLLPGK